MIVFVLGRIVAIEGIAMILPIVTALCFHEWQAAASFGAVAAGAVVIGILLTILGRTKNNTIYVREGFIVVALAWIIMSAIGALPFVLTGDIPAYVDAWFETVSGFTTTGASIVTVPEALTHAAHMWRALTHFIGGMGILVLMVAIFPDSNGRTIHIMRAEMPGPVVDKIVPKARNTAKILYYIYIGLTVSEAVFLLFGGLSVYESVFYALGTAGTGGFGILSTSIGSYSPYVQWVITAFMLLFGVNFNLYFLLLIGKFKRALKSEELWVYIGIVVLMAVLIGVNIRSLYPTLGETIRTSFFQVAAVITTTGYSTADFSQWPTFSKALIFLLFFSGGCAGSTAGGLKLSRIIIMVKSVRRHLKKMLSPRVVYTPRFEGKPLDSAVVHNVATYFVMYMLTLAVFFILVSFQPFDLETNLTATISCFNNVGPAFGRAFSGYSEYSPFVKVVLSAAMFLGRLELYPLMLTFSVGMWSKHKV